MDLRLAPELGLDGLHGQAAGLLAAVAAALADALVDPDPLLRLHLLAALAGAALLGGALLVVDQDGDALDLRQLLLGGEQLGAVAQLGDRRQPDPLVAARVLGGDDDPAHALELEPARQVRDRELALDRLAAGHRDVLVVEQLVGDVHPRGDRRAHRQRARVVEGAVAQVLDEVAVVGERRLADPLGALAAHLREPGDLALALGVEQDHRVAADPGPHERPLGRLDRGVVRAARAEERRALGHRQLGAAGGDLVEPAQVGLDGVELQAAAAQVARDRAGDQVGVHVELHRHQDVALLVALADDPRRVRRAVERLLELGLDEGALLLDHEDLVEPPAELAHRALLERPDHAQLEHADADALELALAEPEAAQRVHQVVVGLAGGDDAEPGVAGALDPVDAVLARVREGEVGAHAEQAALELERGRREQVAVGHVLVAEVGQDRVDAAGSDVGGAERVGDARDDLEARPESRGARAGVGVQAEVDHLGGVAGEEGRHAQARRAATRRRSGSSRTCSSGRRPRRRARRPCARRPTKLPWRRASAARSRPGALPYHMPSTPSYLAPGRPWVELAAPRGGGAELLVEARHVVDEVVLEQLAVARQLLVEAAQRGALVAGDHRPGGQPATAVGAVLLEHEAYERLHAGQEDPALLEDVLVVEADLALGPVAVAVFRAAAALAGARARAGAPRQCRLPRHW